MHSKCNFINYKWLYKRHKNRHVLHKKNKVHTHQERRGSEDNSMTFEAICVEKQEVAGNEYGCVSVPSLSDNMIKSCCPELQCRSVFLVLELSCSKNPNRFTMIKDNFHAQKPNPNSLTPSLSTLPARSQTQHSLYKTTDMLL